MHDFTAILSDAVRDGTLISLVFSRPRSGSGETAEKVTVRPVTVRGRGMYQFARRSGTQETHENLEPQAALDRLSQWFGPRFTDGHLFTTEADYSARHGRKGEVRVRKGPPTKRPAEAVHNRAKNYLIPEDVPSPFLVEIGVMTPAGKVRSAMYHKFRQINRFLELVNDVLPFLPREGELNVVDFGCGKSYLTFALHHLLTGIHGRQVRIIGLDRNPGVIHHCSEVARRLGCEGLEFRIGDIAGHEADRKVHLAVSLHACDTATDDALAKGVGWQADVILAVPCCQHELAGKVHNERLAALERHGILQERFAALVTDALRAEALEICGYRTQVVEFIDLEHTAKNLLIRAVRRPEAEHAAAVASYRELKQSLGLKQVYLEEALGPAFVERVVRAGY